MAIIKCKMCGGDLEVVAESRVAVCEYCGTQQTVPSADSEKKLTLFGRANRLRMACEFDKAAGVYESIVVDFPEEAEAYWGLVLCKYGIEYVDDPATGKKIPTCHRSSFDSIMDDTNLEQAMENADVTAQKVYREEAKQFERIRKGILEVSSSEKPYDIFICYKETDEKGDRTLDSVLAQDLYAALTDKGYRVFFSRITLQGKLGEAYEPYIFAALNSAKVMLAVGTCYEYYNAVWVKNEWSRYLKICEADKSKHLIPCYKDLDPEDMPKEFRHLQGADLGKMGAVQDILFNMEKYIPLKKTVKETVVVQQSAETSKVQTLLERAFLFLEDGDWNAANEYCEKALDIDPKCAEGYLGKLMIDLRVKKQDDLKDCAEPFDENPNYQKAVRFADDKLRDLLTSTNDSINTRNENAHLEEIYNLAKETMEEAVNKEDYIEASELFASIRDYKDASFLVKDCQKMAVAAEKDEILFEAEDLMMIGTIKSCERAIGMLEAIPGWKGADNKVIVCREKIEELKKAQAIARQKKEESAKKTKKIMLIAVSIVCVVIAAFLVVTWIIIPNNRYDEAVALMESGRYEQAIAAFEAMDGYKNSDGMILEAKYEAAVALMDTDVVQAYEALVALEGYKDSAEKVNTIFDEYKAEKFKYAKEGECISFGTYEQDNDTSNGKEPIEWLVLEKQENRALVIGKYAIDCKPYNESRTAVTWETCTLREWLNGEFFNAAFSAKEQAIIQAVTVSGENTMHESNVGNDTKDRVYILSVSETEQYLVKDGAMQCKATAYTEEQGAYVKVSDKCCWWWLRSPGNTQYKAVRVGSSGTLELAGDDVDYLYNAVRPAMWIDLSA